METFFLILAGFGGLLAAIGSAIDSHKHGPQTKRDVLRKYDRREYLQ